MYPNTSPHNFKVKDFGGKKLIKDTYNFVCQTPGSLLKTHQWCLNRFNQVWSWRAATKLKCKLKQSQC